MGGDPEFRSNRQKMVGPLKSPGLSTEALPIRSSTALPQARLIQKLTSWAMHAHMSRLAILDTDVIKSHVLHVLFFQYGNTHSGAKAPRRPVGLVKVSPHPAAGMNMNADFSI